MAICLFFPFGNLMGLSAQFFPFGINEGLKMARSKIDVQGIFDTVIEYCRKIQKFNADENQIALMRIGFDGVFNNAQTAVRAKQLPWKGFVRRDESIDNEALTQCVQSAFAKLFFFHTGKNNGYLGTIINATSELESCYEGYGYCPNPKPQKAWWQLPEGSEAQVEARRLRDENSAACKNFADNCDTFCQVFIYLKTKGQTSSVAGDIWRKAMTGA